MSPSSVHTRLLVGAWFLALLPALHAADSHAPGFQTQASQAVPTLPSKQRAPGLLSGGQNLPGDGVGRRLAASVSPLHRQKEPISAQNDRAQRLSTSLNVQDVIINTYPGAPFTIIPTFEDSRMIIQFLPRRNHSWPRILIPWGSSIRVRSVV